MADDARYDTDDDEMKDGDGLRTRLEQIVGAAYDDAVAYLDEHLSDERAESTDYYNGEPFGNEEEGRSQVVSRDVHDVVQSYMPSLMRILFGSERPVEFQPRSAEDVPLAEQATDYINDVVIQQDNDGFREVHAAIKDALVRKVGIWKWWWEDKTRIEATTHTGLSEDQVLAFREDESVEEVEVKMTSAEGVMPKVFDATVTRRITDGRARFAAIPTDEFLIDRRARSDVDADFMGHRALVTVSDLVAMGYDREVVEAAAEVGSRELDTAEAMARNPAASTLGASGGTAGNPEMRRVHYVEAYIRARLSEDDDDPAQIVKVCGLSGGKAFTLLHYEPTHEMPFASICPDPEPHTFFGRCPADDVKDIQLIKSSVLRGTLDSLALSIHPRYEAVDQAVNLQDLMNSEVGGIVRVKSPGMLREISLPFVGDKTLPMLDYFDRVKESRTKQSQASQGLDADALQSSTKAAVSATISAAQADIELRARIFAETGLKRLFRGLFGLVVRHQDKPRTVRLRNRWVAVDPRSWDAEMDLSVSVALGAGTVEEKLATLAGIAAKQEQVLLAAPGNPMVGMTELRATYAKMAELAGWKDASVFFKEVPADYQPPQPPGEGGQQDAQVLAQVQMADIQAKVQMKQMELQAEQARAELEDRRERERMALDARVKLAVAEVGAASKVQDKQLEAAIRKMEAQQESATRTREAEIAASARPTEGSTA